MLEDFILFLVIITLSIICFILYKDKVNQRKYFINVLTHDLRVSTLAQLRGLECLERNSTKSEFLSGIKESCIYTMDMINMLLNIYKYESRELFLRYSYFNISNILSDTIIFFSSEASGRKICFANMSEKIFVYADVDLIRKLIVNLVDTAISHAQSGSKICIFIKQDSKNVTFSINYKGIGLTEEENNRMLIKNTYFSTVGHGIKMHFCKKIVEFHKGKIYVQNDNDKICLTFTLPLLQYSKIVKCGYRCVRDG